eukprot:9484918-Pyramimonas_sp.AAC.1
MGAEGGGMGGVKGTMGSSLWGGVGKTGASVFSSVCDNLVAAIWGLRGGASNGEEGLGRGGRIGEGSEGSGAGSNGWCARGEGGGEYSVGASGTSGKSGTDSSSGFHKSALSSGRGLAG